MGCTRRFDEIGSGDLAEVGGKAANLGELVRAGLPVPPGFVLTTAAYAAFVAANDLAGRIAGLARRPVDGDTAAFDAAAAGIRDLFRAGSVPEEIAVAVATAAAELTGPFAVRSSATAEDLAGASSAGQQDTFLNVRGEAAVLAAVVDCWASLWTARAMAYRRRQGIAPEAVGLAVVVQEMVEADCSGVLFTADPATGRLDHVVVSAAWGLGESVVGGFVSTDDHVVDKASGAVLSRRVAAKAEMTGYADGAGTGTVQRPVPDDRRTAPVLDDAALAGLARLGARIERHFGVPQDVEWARAGAVISVLQSRPITALPEPAADPPSGWPVPYPRGLYFRASIVEQMPDPLTPLFADLIDGSVTRSVSALLERVMAAGRLHPGDVSLPTINGYAYYFYAYGGFGRMLAATPAMVRAMAAAYRGGNEESSAGVRGWREWAHPRYVRTVAGWADQDLTGLSSSALLDGVSALLDAGTEYYTAVQSIIPVAATSELAFRAYYDRLVRRPGDPAAETFLLGFDSRPILAEKSLYDLAAAARDAGLAAAVARATADDLLFDGPPPAGADESAWRHWRGLFRDHLEHYGHTVYNLDFADPVPADEPAPLLDTVRFYLDGLGSDGQGSDPHQRQQRSAARRESQTAAVRERLDPVRRAAFDRLLRWAQNSGPVREDALADMGLAWPLIRRMLRELGRRFVATGVLADPDEVFWLRHEELRAAVRGEPLSPALAAEIGQRRMLWRGRRKVTAPQLLPEIRWLSRLLAGVMPAADQNQTGSSVTGVAGGSGRVTGLARVLDGPADFGQLQPGEVLVARMTTPAWTSLFAKAAAVVTDVGGPLSHSSIVAREYGIPAVLGTGSATGRIRTGQRVRVDGDAGTVTLLDATSPDDATEVPAGPSAGRRLLPAAAAVAAGAVLLRRRHR
jgi:pyruvate,water dikinase